MNGGNRAEDALHREGMEPQSWSNGPRDTYAPHRHDYDKVLFATRGSIVFRLPELDRSVELIAGDRLDLPAGTLHAADVGSDGVACVEGHARGGSLPGGLRHARRWLDAEWGRADGHRQTERPGRA